MTPSRGPQLREVWLLGATFLVAVAGLIYELIAATLSSYLLGDSVRQFSLVIGVFLAAMGLGAWLSRFVTHALPGFVWAQILLGILGGFLAPVLYFSYMLAGVVGLPLYAMLICIGVLSGMEIPLIARVLKEIGAPEFRFENVLSVDYVGALVASVAFPLLILPHLGLMSASLAFGCLNLLVAGLSLWIFRDRMGGRVWAVWGVALVLSLAALVQAERLVSVVEANLFEDDVILSETTPYQQITLTRFRDRTRLFLDYSIQFDTLDEYRYHESLVHPAMALAPRRSQVLILGGGDGMAAREVLRHADVQAVTLVDLDARVTELFAGHADLVALNGNALNDPRLMVVSQDAWAFVGESRAVYDVVIVDLPDPKSIALSKLYSLEFYGMLADRISAQGLIAVQAGSPMFARQAYWSVVQTLAATRNPQVPGQGLAVVPYHAYVPSFGDWGFVLASPRPLAPRPLQLPPGLRYMTDAIWREAQVFAPDVADMAADLNRIQSHALVGYYNEGWDYWFR
ncbi:polyamine aminopropyltransferase [Fertoebacter nigrum]|uniref:Polyamine aminopropyltransferase n=1 Tax=Fertoeibacter niger TaxID=2656921 RepID=A0A8X8KRI9_9RHOB|nr:polyamine aminopropyltransferase [Fertoeibacter niger]NUB45292.1 polyamine aminopropyltransferase [Fertoeibacter niger]